MKRVTMALVLIVSTSLALAVTVNAQPPGGFGPGGRGGPGGPGGPNRADRKLVKEHDADGNGWLNREERATARKAIEAEATEGGAGRGGFGGRGGPGGRRGRGGPGGRGGNVPQGTPGPAVAVDSVAVYPDKPLYDTSTLRTVFLEFEGDDWEEELEVFKHTDVDVVAKMIVDGKTYENVGVAFRGMSSFSHVSRGNKRSFNISLDMVNEDQRIDGYKTLNLLNCHGDPSMMSSVVYSHIAGQYIPTPKANFVQVVVNGKSWGVFDSVQQFDKKFIAENFNGSKGTRWKVSGSPNGDGGLRYLGDDLEEYKSRFEMKSNDGTKAWTALVQLCKTLNETPSDQLEAALDPILDIDGALKFLALDVVLANSDGYWTRASDYNLFRDKEGKFHLIPHDMNEAFALANRGGRGPGGRGPGGPGFGGPGFGGPGFGGPGFGGPGDEGPGPRGPGFGGPGFGGPGGRGPGGQGPEGRGPEGRGPEAQGPEGQTPGPRGPGFGRPGFERPQGEGDQPGFGPPPGEQRNFGGRGQRGPGGRGGPGGGGPGHGGVDLDPLVGLDNERMPLRSRLLSVPTLQKRYLQYVNQIVNDSLIWDKLGPVVEDYRDLIEPSVKADTRKLTTYEGFVAATRSELDESDTRMSLKKFALERSKYLNSKK
jgi:hypothetical protein